VGKGERKKGGSRVRSQDLFCGARWQCKIPVASTLAGRTFAAGTVAVVQVINTLSRMIAVSIPSPVEGPLLPARIP